MVMESMAVVVVSGASTVVVRSGIAISVGDDGCEGDKADFLLVLVLSIAVSGVFLDKALL